MELMKSTHRGHLSLTLKGEGIPHISLTCGISQIYPIILRHAPSGLAMRNGINALQSDPPICSG
jgi:hypothetical protein